MTEPSQKALLPCPFCGSEAELYEKDLRPLKGTYYNVRCEACECWMDFRQPSKAKAIAAWNRRAHPDSEVREALGEVDSGHMHACRIAAAELEANGFEAIPKDLRAVADALGRLLGEEGGG